MPDVSSLVERSRHLLAEARYMTLASSDGTLPWASTLNFVALRRPLRLLFYSSRTARHSRNVEQDPRVSGSVYLTGLPGFGLDGAQFTGRCHPVGPERVEEFHRAYYDINFPDERTRSAWRLPLSDFHGPGPRRFYVVEVSGWWLLDIDRWLHDKHDQRIAVPLENLTAG